MRHALSGAMLLLLLTCALGAQESEPPAWTPPEPQPGEPLCGTCKTSGRIVFELDAKWDVEHGPGGDAGWEVLHCSEAIESDNHGLDWEPCPRCKTPSLKALADETHAAEVARREAWLAERRKVDKALGVKEPLLHMETTHFILAWNIPKVTTADKKTYRSHEAMHLYAERFEEVYAWYQDLLGIEDSNNMVNKHYIYVFADERTYREAAPRYTGLIGPVTVKRMGGVDQDSSIATWWSKGEHPKEEDFYRHLAHNLIHQIASVYYDLKWFEPGQFGLMPPWLNDKYGWLDAGLAHWFERQLPGRITTYCMREQDITARWKGDDWRKNVLKAVQTDDVPIFAETITRPTQALTAKEHQFCWSWVDFLMERDPLAMGRMMALAKQEAPTRDMLKEAYGFTLPGFDTAWREWVAVTYAPKKGR